MSYPGVAPWTPSLDSFGDNASTLHPFSKVLHLLTNNTCTSFVLGASSVVQKVKPLLAVPASCVVMVTVPAARLPSSSLPTQLESRSRWSKWAYWRTPGEAPGSTQQLQSLGKQTSRCKIHFLSLSLSMPLPLLLYNPFTQNFFLTYLLLHT